MIPFKGNCPQSVRRDAKYHIRLKNGEYVVGINYTTENGEYWTPTTTEHPQLVEMVNSVKSNVQERPGGAFYINEFRQVIVPTDKGYMLAGEYKEPLSFHIQDDSIGMSGVVTGEAMALDGKPLNIGDIWEGYLMGIPYVLMANGRDIRYDVKLSEDHYRRIFLSKVTNVIDAKKLANRLQAIMPETQGGRFYINDMREMFKPKNTSQGIEYIYIGHLKRTDVWFPKEINL